MSVNYTRLLINETSLYSTKDQLKLSILEDSGSRSETESFITKRKRRVANLHL